MTTFTREQWGKERADWWSAAQTRRGQIYGAATEMMLDVAAVEPGSRVLDVAAGTGDQTLIAARRVGPTGYVLATDQSSSPDYSSRAVTEDQASPVASNGPVP